MIKMQNKPMLPMKKVTASNVGSIAIGMPAAIVVAWLVSLAGMDMPEDVKMALAAIIAWASGLIASLLATD
jgi:hypothetical protein